MTSARKALSVLLAGLMLATVPSGLWATSAVSDPNTPFGIQVDPNASGTKLSGELTLAYEVVLVTNACDGSASVPAKLVLNIFAVLTLQKGNTAQTFNGDIQHAGVGWNAAGVCFDEHQPFALSFVDGLITTKVIPSPTFFGPCGGVGQPACPNYAVKSLTNILSSGGGGLSADIVLAVR